MKRILPLLIQMVVVPVTVLLGYFLLEDKKYYFISFVLIVEALLSLMLMFEKKSAKVSDVITIAVMSSIVALSRVAFYSVPEIKPMLSLIIISAIVFGKESGAMIGMLGSFASNIYFGQGPWTPWQMFGASLIGFLAGLVFQKQKLKENRLFICIFGFLTTLVCYGGVLNFYATLSYTDVLNREILLATYTQGFPLDFIHACSTFLFLLWMAKPVIQRLERVKKKFQLMSGE